MAWKVSVSTTSAPASTIDAWTPSMTSGRLRTSASWQRPGQLVVLLEREVELLERGAHAAVEDDDAVADGGQEVTHATMHRSATLTQLCQGWPRIEAVARR